MLVTTDGIVLHFIKYGGSSVIATIFTREYGRQSFIINAARSKNSKNKAGILQPLFLVNIVAYEKQSRDIQRVKEIVSSRTYQNLPFNVVKFTQAVFIAEILYKTINEQESYPEIYDFIQNSLLYFDLMEKGVSNFHLWFLFRLTEYLGFLPSIPFAGEGWFDLQKGTVVASEPAHMLFMNRQATNVFMNLSVLKIHELSGFRIPHEMRSYLLEQIIKYYQLHFENLREIKSFKVLKELFS
ncbi:MAG: DNA repair protein RecO [Bacteroidales bacterium]|jgi:DNA repair protein RecO (recombination protein O)|nr:DNA repair protein RecO [Bacteroidales bacterium]